MTAARRRRLRLERLRPRDMRPDPALAGHVARARAEMPAFDGMAPRVREALNDTMFELDARDFAGMDQRDAYSYVRSIDNEVRAADARDQARRSR